MSRPDLYPAFSGIREHPAGRRLRLLFLAYYFPPVNTIGAIRARNIAKWLSRRGWDVTVATPSPLFWRDTEAAEEVEPMLEREGIRRLSTGHRWRFLSPRYLVPAYEHRRRLGRALASRLARLGRRGSHLLGVRTEIGWMSEALRSCRGIDPSQVDVILATATPFCSFELARRLSRRLGRPYVLDYRDLWTANPFVPNDFSPSNFRKEKLLLADCAAAITVSRSLADSLKERFGLPGRIHVVPNGFDPEELGQIVPRRFGHFAIVYAGRFYPPKSTIHPVMAALGRLQTASRAADTGWAFHYFGPHSDHVREAARRFGVERRVLLHGNVTRREALEAVAGAGVSVAVTTVLPDGNREEKGIVTGKLFEAIGLGVSVLAIAPAGSDIENTVETSGLGRRISGDQVDAIAAFLAAVMAGRSPTRREPSRYSWVRLAGPLDAILREAALRSPQKETGSQAAPCDPVAIDGPTVSTAGRKSWR